VDDSEVQGEKDEATAAVEMEMGLDRAETDQDPDPACQSAASFGSGSPYGCSIATDIRLADWQVPLWMAPTLVSSHTLHWR
jgi:hypothetical protein